MADLHGAVGLHVILFAGTALFRNVTQSPLTHDPEIVTAAAELFSRLSQLLHLQRGPGAVHRNDPGHKGFLIPVEDDAVPLQRFLPLADILVALTLFSGLALYPVAIVSATNISERDLLFHILLP